MSKSNNTKLRRATQPNTLSPSTQSIPESSRRDFLKTGLFAGVASTGALSMLTPKQAQANRANRLSSRQSRYYQTLRKRFDAMISNWRHANSLASQATNGDEQRYAEQSYYASYSKALPHNDFGEVDADAFEQLVSAMRSNHQSDYDAIPLSSIAGRGLVNPEAAHLYSIEGLDSHASRIHPSHVFRSAAIAAEMGELYWKALLRDLPYRHYESAAEISDALADLNRFSAAPGPKVNGQITAQTLFRGETDGDLVGPYISQLLWQNIPWGPLNIEQRYNTPVSGVDFMTDTTNWLNIQQGALPQAPITFDTQAKYIYNHRSLGEYVHTDLPYQAYVHAALILLGYGRDALDHGNPYKTGNTNRVPFTSFGVAYVLDLVSRAANLGLSAAWYQKWAKHRFLRPEMFAGRIHFLINHQRSYEINKEILNCDALRLTFNQHGTFLLPQAFPEGSPTHPSYPAEHACVAGACATVLKALFNEEFVIPNPVVCNETGTALENYVGSDLTIGGEINKLANNICIGRNTAGVHYRQDGTQGLEAGEQMAISMLKDHSRLTEFEGFNLTRFNGQTITIRNGRVR